MPEKTNSITRVHTLETFMKTITKLKISDNVLEDFIHGLDELAAKITKTSEKFAEEEKRKTIMPPDLAKAWEEILKTGPLSVDEILGKIEPLSIIELSQLAKKIQQKADDLLKPRAVRKAKK